MHPTIRNSQASAAVVVMHGRHSRHAPGQFQPHADRFQSRVDDAEQLLGIGFAPEGVQAVFQSHVAAEPACAQRGQLCARRRASFW